MSNNRQTIGKVAVQTGCHIEAIRYYEKEGLLPPPGRTEAGHRLYSNDLAERLVFIRRSRELGFSMKETRELLSVLDEEQVSCEQVKRLADTHLQDIHLKIRDLRKTEKKTMNTNYVCAAVCATLVLSLLTTPVANAHHGLDFLLTQTAHLPMKGEIYGVTRQNYMDKGEENEWEFEPALIGSVTDWLTLEAHSHIEKIQGKSAEYESTAVTGYIRFTPRESAFAVGAAIEYEVARHDDEDDVWAFAGLASYEGDRWTIGFNLLTEREAAGGAETEWGYAVGVRRAISDKVAAGVEITGTLEDEKEGEFLVGIFFDPIPWLTVNVGVGTGFNGGTDLAVRSAIVFRFR